MTAHDPRVTLTESEREAIWAGLRRARHEEAPISLAHEFHKTHVLWAVGPAVEEIIAARLAPIRAVAEQWDTGCAREVLAVLDAPVSASQDHDGAEGQGGGERCSCGNDFDGDNLCMVSACQWEGIDRD